MTRLIVWLIITVACCATSHAQTLKKPVWAYDATLQGLSAEVQPYQLGTSWWWFDYQNGAYDFSKVSVNKIRGLIDRKPDPHLPLMIDIENFSLRTDSDKDFKYNIQQLKTAISEWQKKVPTRKIGFYDMWYRDYWNPYNKYLFRNKYDPSNAYDRAKFIEYATKVRTWKKGNDRIATELKKLKPDFACFSIYDFYDSPCRWRIYADENIQEMARLYPNTKRMVIIQPSRTNGDALAVENWRMMVNFCADHPDVDIVCVFVHPRFAKPENWQQILLDAVAAEVE